MQQIPKSAAAAGVVMNAKIVALKICLGDFVLQRDVVHALLAVGDALVNIV